MRIVFYNRAFKESGGIFVRFTDPPQYMIAFCSNWKTFDFDLPEEQNKIWTISKDKDRISVKCNDFEFINFIPSDNLCDRWVDWRTYWGRYVVRVKFTKKVDKASRAYRIQLPPSEWVKVPRGHKFKLDLQQEPLEVFSNSKFGSGDQLRVNFYDSRKDPAGGVYISLSSPPRYMIPYCVLWRKFHWKDAKLIQSLQQEKVATIERTLTGVRIQYNGAEVLDFHLSDETCTHRHNWRDYWDRQVDRVEFHPSLDTASKSCRVQTPPDPPTPKPLRPWTVSPRKGRNWYGTYPPSEEPTKNVFVKECWMKGAGVGGTVLHRAEWKGREQCEELCVQQEGCHVIMEERYNRRTDPGQCVIIGVYNVYQHPSPYDASRVFFSVAERKCFDPEHYNSATSPNSPCGDHNWECRERCIELEWRCDGEYDCDNGEDEAECPNYNSPVCPPGQWNCYEHRQCPDKLSEQDLMDGRSCERCIPEESVCDGWNRCYYGEDERDCTDKESVIRD